MDYLPDGDLRSYLEEKHNSMTWSVRQIMLRNISLAVCIIHQLNIIHGDIHSGNVLIRFHTLAVLADFGLSKAFTTSATSSKGSYGIIPYMAPELLLGQPYSAATDIYAL